MDKLDLLIKEKQAELRGLLAELQDALTDLDIPDYETAGRLQPIVYAVMREIRQLESLGTVSFTPDDFQANFSRFLTDDTLHTLELWTFVRGFYGHGLETPRLESHSRGKDILPQNQAAKPRPV